MHLDYPYSNAWQKPLKLVLEAGTKVIFRKHNGSHLAASVEYDESEVEWLIGTGVNLGIDGEKVAEKIEREAHIWAIDKANKFYNRLEKSYVLHTSHDNIKTRLTDLDTVYDEFGEVIR